MHAADAGLREGKSARRRHLGNEAGTSPLTLFTAWLHGADGFTRPAHVAGPPLPLKFTCKACGEQVHPQAMRCSRCLAKLTLNR